MIKEDLVFDVIVVGSGIAGLNCVRLIDPKYKVAILCKDVLKESASVLAQGGIAAVTGINPEDNVQNHIKDTLNTGAGLSKPSVVSYVVSEGKNAIDDLIKIGVNFSIRDNLGYDLTKEGGHSNRRIYHSDDLTGANIVEHLIEAVKTKKNIKIFENHTSINLIKNENDQVCGVHVLDADSKVKNFFSRLVVLATGGAGKVYLFTSNPDIATGDGIAMAYRVGAKIANMEFYQFHPTCLYHPNAKNFLISESLRGEGAKLLLPDGSSFMHKYDERGELAPRDIVARAIDSEMKKYGLDCVFLDITHKEKEFIKKRFPNIYKKCLSLGIDITKNLIPVVPAAHYSCGGIKVDLSGSTNIKGLSACGECSSTGLHGANRLASNSLLEAMVFSKKLADDIEKNMIKCEDINKEIKWEEAWAKKSEEAVLVNHNWDELRLNMWNNVGIIRSFDRLKRALNRIEMIKTETESYYWRYKITKDLVELRNLITVSELIVRSAMSRLESRGLHYMKDYPNQSDAYLKDTVI